MKAKTSFIETPKAEVLEAEVLEAEALQAMVISGVRMKMRARNTGERDVESSK